MPKGRPPEPTALKLLRGVRKDRVNDAEPVPGGEVVPPELVSAAGLEVWHRLAPDLIRKGVLTSWDADRFGVWCDAMARTAEAAQHLNAEGAVIESPVFDRNGQPTGSRTVQNPWFQVWKQSADVVAREGARFGLSPTERQALKVDDGRSEDPKARLLTS